MSESTPRGSFHKQDCLWLLAVAAIVFLITEIPYRYAGQRAPENTSFVGQIAVADDVNSYFSFIRQAESGHILFQNNMTHIEHRRVFVNLEWLVLGWIMRFFELSPPALFKIWRAAGAVTLLAGFGLLAHVTLKHGIPRRTALIMCAFGGGFGWMLTGISKLGLIDLSAGLGLQNPAMDLITALHPFGQITKNPHFSLPHGTMLATIALYVVGEQKGDTRWYAGAAVMTVIHGLMRPYDLISLWAVVPAFIVVEAALARRMDWPRGVLRALPLLASAPLLAYYVYLFSVHPVFKFWASQGGQPSAPIGWHVLSYGLAGVLFVFRLIAIPRRPITASGERFLAAWVIIVFALFHSHTVLPFLPYSPQLAIPLATPMILVGVSALPISAAGWPPALRGKALAAVAAFLVVNALTSPLYILRACRDAVSRPHHFIHVDDAEAMAWLSDHVGPTDVILADYVRGGIISQRVTARVVLGHWALTPHANALRGRIQRLMSGAMSSDEAREFAAQTRARYVYISPVTEELRRRYFDAIPGWTKEFENGQVAIYGVGGEQPAAEP